MAKHEYEDVCAEFKRAVRAARASTWKQYVDKIRKGVASETASAIKRMRRNRRANVTLSSPEGPQHAANQMVDHLERVFGGSNSLRTTPGVTPSRNVVKSPWILDTVLEAIKYLPNRKAPGADHIRAEMLKPLANALGP
ncbi:hypothetical protein DFQ30_005117, partial [Apophysomyces sp. BC1015]